MFCVHEWWSLFTSDFEFPITECSFSPRGPLVVLSPSCTQRRTLKGKGEKRLIASWKVCFQLKTRSLIPAMPGDVLNLAIHDTMPSIDTSNLVLWIIWIRIVTPNSLRLSQGCQSCVSQRFKLKDNHLVDTRYQNSSRQVH